MSGCCIPGCTNQIRVQSRQLCRAHYLRWCRHGDPIGGRQRFNQGKDLTVDVLREMLHYNQKTGVFTRKIAIANQPAGSIAGCLNKDGYIRISVNGREYLGHRLAFFYNTGAWPAKLVDHENFVRSDNRWSNIRPASFNQNNHRRVVAPNATGFRGVTFISKTGRWRAKISVSGKSVHLGVFAAPALAHRAYVKASQKYYGTFATTESRAA